MKNNKGFTLVEIIVVLVILAILAAATIPSMLGFVNDAKKKANSAEVRAVYLAMQSYVIEQFATSTNIETTKTAIQTALNNKDIDNTPDSVKNKLSGDASGTISEVTFDAGNTGIKSFGYEFKNGQFVRFTNGSGIDFDATPTVVSNP